MSVLSKLWQIMAAGIIYVSLVIGPAHAEEKLNAIDGVAMDGFDVISYFDASKAAKGAAEFSHEYRGATWLFATAENRDKFAADPAKYEPKYNGWCANAVSKGYAADVDFVNGWAVIDGSLHLFWANSTKHNFFSEVTAKQVRAEDNWPTVFAGLLDGTTRFPRHADHFETVGISHPQELPEL
ncbi:YHS domain-containing (seleno)protein [uncultured Tateyamaria sp.]|uniref:YHS domain-containing (seleno)protein n=1 Tax=uncultured Tateyamaria sp. TaxID=455651 RepID=UPI0026082E08|nr:YHS domain-containing (seleno)protein [uncultured Tateyamaria sp.]